MVTCCSEEAHCSRSLSWGLFRPDLSRSIALSPLFLATTMSELLDSARRITRTASISTFWIGLLFVPRCRRPYFFVWYAYFRLLDDTLDSSLSPEQALRQIENELSFVRRLYKGTVAPDSVKTVREQLLDALVAFDRNSRCQLRRPIIALASSLRYELLGRMNEHDWRTTTRRWWLEVSGYLQTLSYFCADAPPSLAMPASAGIGGKIVHVLRDAVKDARADQIQLPMPPEIHRALASGRAHEPEFHRGVAMLIGVAARHFSTGVREINRHPSRRYRLAALWLCAKYLHHIDQIIGDNFILREIYEGGPIRFARRAKWLFRLCHFRILSRASVADGQLVTIPEYYVDRSRTLDGASKALMLARHSIRSVPFVTRDNLGILIARRPWRHLRRMILAYSLGRAISEYVVASGSRGRGGSTVDDAAGRLFARWVAALVAIDSSVDERLPESFDAHQFTGSCLNILRGQTNGTRSIPGGYGARNVELAFRRCADFNAERSRFEAQLSGNAHETSKALRDAEFFDRTAALMEGQALSAEQFDVYSPHDWAWYYGRVLNTKTLNAFMAPLSLFATTASASSRCADVKELFLGLNTAYFHWQLIDDVADLATDVTAGLITSPGFLLISQADVAARFLAHLNREDTDPQHMNEILDRSELLTPRLVLPYGVFQVAGQNHCASTSYDLQRMRRRVSLAISNIPEEHLLNTETLCVRRVQQREMFLDGLRRTQPRKALRALADSHTTARILSSSLDIPRLAAVRQRVGGLESRELRRIAALIEGAIQRAARNAIKMHDHLTGLRLDAKETWNA